MSDSNQQVAVVPAGGQSIQVRQPSHVAAEKLFRRSTGSPAATVEREYQDRVTRQELADYAETTDPNRFPQEHIATAQRLMATYGTDALRNAVAAAGIGSNVHVFDIAARLQMALDAKDARIADLTKELAALKAAQRRY